MQWAFFILDGAKDLSHSRYWLKVQRPYIEDVSDEKGSDFRGIRNITAIQTVRDDTPAK